MPDIASATNLIEFYKSREAIIRNCQLQFEFSTREEIVKRSELNNGAASTGGGGRGGKRGKGPGPPNHILMVMVSDVQYEMSLEILHQVASSCHEIYYRL